MFGINENKRSSESQIIINDIKSKEFGLAIFDEVHVAPAATFRKCAFLIKTNCKLGLTATLLREDNKIIDLFCLIGPKLYEANWLKLQNDGYLAKVICVQIDCKMTKDFENKYLHYNVSKNKQRFLKELINFNPNKLKAMKYLINIHQERGDKVLVFCDSIVLIKYCAQLLDKPYIYGNTGNRERQCWLNKFNDPLSSTNCLFMSCVGDTAINLPNVNVIIQISSHYGSRRQETQRLGRILRPKNSDNSNNSNHSNHSNYNNRYNEFDAFFYTLISTDTIDAKYCQQRQKYLVDQGYLYHIINSTDLINENNNNSKDNTKYVSPTEILALINYDNNDNDNDEDDDDDEYVDSDDSITDNNGNNNNNNRKNKNNKRKRKFIETEIINNNKDEPPTKKAHISTRKSSQNDLNDDDEIVSLRDNNNKLPTKLLSDLKQNISKRMIYIGRCNGLLFGKTEKEIYAKTGEIKIIHKIRSDKTKNKILIYNLSDNTRLGELDKKILTIFDKFIIDKKVILRGKIIDENISDSIKKKLPQNIFAKKVLIDVFGQNNIILSMINKNCKKIKNWKWIDKSIILQYFQGQQVSYLKLRKSCNDVLL